ncbi:hypothetical protein Nepgr_011925 [Nepenthes gracilis]|uniref:Uncharacterized protein n=1 Tax=Nepenthes gracilis TaxID=150966 RepID=A0AAD3SG65_NEPGR|nr:hypothetical protein Nepgr_011925 [Nepenthes gracilis]
MHRNWAVMSSRKIAEDSREREDDEKTFRSLWYFRGRKGKLSPTTAASVTPLAPQSRTVDSSVTSTSLIVDHPALLPCCDRSHGGT